MQKIAESYIQDKYLFEIDYNFENDIWLVNIFNDRKKGFGNNFVECLKVPTYEEAISKCKEFLNNPENANNEISDNIYDDFTKEKLIKIIEDKNKTIGNLAIENSLLFKYLVTKKGVKII